MLFQCWASVVDDGPTLKQHWFNAMLAHRLRHWANIETTVVERLVFTGSALWWRPGVGTLWIREFQSTPGRE